MVLVTQDYNPVRITRVYYNAADVRIGMEEIAVAFPVDASATNEHGRTATVTNSSVTQIRNEAGESRVIARVKCICPHAENIAENSGNFNVIDFKFEYDTSSLLTLDLSSTALQITNTIS